MAIKRSTPVINLIEISPVDLTAQAIVKLFDKRLSNNHVYHLFNPNLFDLTNTLNDHGCKILPVELFINYLKQQIKNGKYYDLILRFLLHQGWINWSGRDINSVNILQDRTNNILKMVGFNWVPISDKVISSYLES